MKKADIEAISAFSEGFAKRLRDWTEEHELRQTAIASETGRTQAWVSERLRGVRPVDTDLLAVIARLTDITPRDLTQRIVDDMGGGQVVPIRKRPAAPAPRAGRVGQPKKKAARKDRDPNA